MWISLFVFLLVHSLQSVTVFIKSWTHSYQNFTKQTTCWRNLKHHWVARNMLLYCIYGGLFHHYHCHFWSNRWADICNWAVTPAFMAAKVLQNNTVNLDVVIRMCGLTAVLNTFLCNVTRKIYKCVNHLIKACKALFLRTSWIKNTFNNT